MRMRAYVRVPASHSATHPVGPPITSLSWADVDNDGDDDDDGKECGGKGDTPTCRRMLINTPCSDDDLLPIEIR